MEEGHGYYYSETILSVCILIIAYKILSSESKQILLRIRMQHAWAEHGQYTREYIIWESYNLPNISVRVNKLLRNQKDIAVIFEEYYGEEVAVKVEELLKQHIKLASLTVKSSKKGGESIKALVDQLFANGDEIAQALVRTNPKFGTFGEVQQMIHTHLHLMLNMVTKEFSKKHQAGTNESDTYNLQLVHMANSLTDGIIKQKYPISSFFTQISMKNSVVKPKPNSNCGPSCKCDPCYCNPCLC